MFGAVAACRAKHRLQPCEPKPCPAEARRIYKSPFLTGLAPRASAREHLPYLCQNRDRLRLILRCELPANNYSFNPPASYAVSGLLNLHGRTDETVSEKLRAPNQACLNFAEPGKHVCKEPWSLPLRAGETAIIIGKNAPLKKHRSLSALQGAVFRRPSASRSCVLSKARGRTILPVRTLRPMMAVGIPNRTEWNQYMLSYIDCDLSYLRSESDAAFTPMLKLQLR